MASSSLPVAGPKHDATRLELVPQRRSKRRKRRAARLDELASWRLFRRGCVVGLGGCVRWDAQQG
eukprot:jgi/Pico_ML_1/52805/g3459.t1